MPLATWLETRLVKSMADQLLLIPVEVTNFGIVYRTSYVTQKALKELYERESSILRQHVKSTAIGYLRSAKESGFLTDAEWTRALAICPEL